MAILLNLVKSKHRFSTARDCNATARAVSGLRQDMLLFAGEQLRTQQLSDDQREFLELVISFVEGQPILGVRFMARGAMHHARWMAKAKYAVKVFMFRSQFKLTAREEKALQHISLLVVTVYIRTWCNAPLPTSAAVNGLAFIKAFSFSVNKRS